MRKRVSVLAGWIMAVALIVGCGQGPSDKVTELAHFPLDDMGKVISRSDVQIDKVTTSDGKGSLKVTANQFTVIRLFETGDLDVENARLIYRAKVRTKNVEGQAFLAMECHFPGKGDFFARDVATPLTGSTEWTTEEVHFSLKKGENPDNVKLHLVINGKGTAWIDDVRLLRAPLK